MKNSFKRSPAEALSEEVQLQEIDERHFLAQQVFFRRQERDWSQERLAQESGLTQAQVATLEAGQANPTLRTLVKLAVVFGIRIRDLIAPHEQEADGCTAEDRRGAETLWELAVYYRSGEEGHSAEFRVASTPPSNSGTRSPQSAFRAHTAKRHAPGAQPSVTVDMSQAANLEVEELAATLEL
jgi:transcriptional regulator with XRE-family HTH domain